MGIGDWFRKKPPTPPSAKETQRGRKKSHDDIIQHMAHHFGPVQELAIMEIVPVTGVAINIIPARPGQNPLILFTTGMSDRPQTVPAGQDEYRYTELFIQLPTEWPTDKERLTSPNYFWPIEWLKRIACYPHDNDTWLGGPFPIIANGDPPAPLAPNTNLSCLLLLQEQGEAGTVRCQDGRQVTLYKLIPLYTEERDLEMRNGIRPLFEGFQKHGMSFVVDPQRVNTVTGR